MRRAYRDSSLTTTYYQWLRVTYKIQQNVYTSRFATKGVGGIIKGTIVKDGEGVSAVAFVRNSLHFAFVRI